MIYLMAIYVKTLVSIILNHCFLQHKSMIWSEIYIYNNAFQQVISFDLGVFILQEKKLFHWTVHLSRSACILFPLLCIPCL